MTDEEALLEIIAMCNRIRGAGLPASQDPGTSKLSPTALIALPWWWRWTHALRHASEVRMSTLLSLRELRAEAKHHRRQNKGRLGGMHEALELLITACDRDIRRLSRLTRRRKR